MNKLKNNLTSLSAYRKKKKRSLKKTSKVASNDSHFFVDIDSDSKNLQNNKETKIYDIFDHKKQKEVPEGKGYIKNWGQTTEPEQKSKPSEPISLEKYREKRNSQTKIKRKRSSRYYAREALSFTAMTFMMLLALNVFFPRGQEPLNSKIVKNNLPANEQPKKGEREGLPDRKLAKDKSKDQQVIFWEKPKVIFGKKPRSSEHTGF